MQFFHSRVVLAHMYMYSGIFLWSNVGQMPLTNNRCGSQWESNLGEIPMH